MSENQSQKLNPNSNERETQRETRVLLIDDDPGALSSIGDLLETEGFAVTREQDSRMAAERIEHDGFDIILTDMRMPELDGMDILRCAREADESACVVFFSGHATPQSVSEALTAGAADYLLKPLEFSHLSEALNRAQLKNAERKTQRHLVESLEESNLRLSRHIAELNALYESSNHLSSTGDLTELLENILALAAKVTTAEVGSVMLVDNSGEYLRVAAAAGLDSNLVKYVRQPMGESISGFVAKSGKPLLIENVESDNRFQRKSKERYGNASLISVPLKIGPRTLGVINLSRKIGGGVFKEADLRLLMMFASQAAVAIDDARQFEEKSRQLREFEALHALSANMNTVTSEEEMSKLVFETLQRILPLEYLIWLKHDPRSRTLKLVDAVGKEFNRSDSGKIIIGDESLPEQVIHSVDSGLLGESDRKSRDNYTLTSLGALGFTNLENGAFIAAPALRNNSVTYLFCLGAEYIDSYSDHERSLVEIVVSQAAVMYEKEKSVINTSRLVTMGNMISEISHDLRKPLTTIKGSVSLLRKRINANEDCTEILRLVEGEAHRLNELVTELVDFSKPTKYEAEKCDLRRLAVRALELVGPDLEKHKISTSLSFSDNSWDVIVNKNQVFEAILNLLMNAIDAMADNADAGELTVSGSKQYLDFKDGEFLAFSVSDTGCGISKEDQSRLFDRYFTTKETGTGLGLAVVERVMSAHNGTVGVESAIGQGATITLYFPNETPRASLLAGGSPSGS